MAVIWTYGNNDAMKISLDIPDEIMQRVKLWAACGNRKFTDAIVQLLKVGLSEASGAERLPAAPKPVRLEGHGLLDIQSIEAAIGTSRQ